MFKHILMIFTLMMGPCTLQKALCDEKSRIIGTWLTQKNEKNAKIKIEPCASNPAQFCGKIIWLQEPTYPDGAPKVDKHNKDEGLRNRPLMNLEILTDFISAENDTWVDGTIYNPEDGESYSCTISLIEEDGKEYLDVHGYIGITLFGKTQRWVRNDS
jgi:uncharacterized protein (DUF2147 family)